ncbi:sigma-70 family RNA polymerase sigma factor [Rossellomorea vietnamensis]|nr:sigma-70 family RNA polymerase sigma factor [Rossellomorea vietnamensis]
MDIQQLYKLYIQDVYRYLLSLCKDKSLAEDLTQDTFVKAYTALENIEPEAMKSWLLKIAYHTFIDYARRSKKVTFEEPDYFSGFSEGGSAEDEFQKLADKEDLYQKLDRLKPLQKRAIILCDIQGYSYKEAAAALFIKENTLKSHIFRGRSRLKLFYKKGSDEENE